MIWHPVLASFTFAIEALHEGSCARETLSKHTASSKMHGGQAKSNKGCLSHVLCDSSPYLTLTSLKRFMKRGPKRQGLWRWHCRELTVIWVARCDATATMNTASYIKAASVCGGGWWEGRWFFVFTLQSKVHVKYTRNHLLSIADFQ